MTAQSAESRDEAPIHTVPVSLTAEVLKWELFYWIYTYANNESIILENLLLFLVICILDLMLHNVKSNICCLTLPSRMTHINVLFFLLGSSLYQWDTTGHAGPLGVSDHGKGWDWSIK